MRRKTDQFEFDFDLARRERDEAIERAEVAAPMHWTDLALEAVRAVCLDLRLFTSDNVWQTGLEPPPEPRAFGGVMTRAARLGYCRKTGELKLSCRRSRHAAPLVVWESLICRAR